MQFKKYIKIISRNKYSLYTLLYYNIFFISIYILYTPDNAQGIKITKVYYKNKIIYLLKKILIAFSLNFNN